MEVRQLSLLPVVDGAVRVEVTSGRGSDPCAGCGRPMSRRMQRESLWGKCKACEAADLVKMQRESRA